MTSAPRGASLFAKLKRRLKHHTWIFRNANPVDFMRYFFTWRRPSTTIRRELPPPPSGGGGGVTGEPRPFLLVKCAGFKHENLMLEVLEQRGENPVRLGRYKGFGSAALALYRIDPAAQPAERWLWLLAMQQLHPDDWDMADLWTLDCPASRLPGVKRAIRRKLGLEFYRVRYQGRGRLITINPVHSPEPGNIDAEWRILTSCLHK